MHKLGIHDTIYGDFKMTKLQFKKLAIRQSNLENAFMKLNKKELYSNDEIYALCNAIENATTKFYEYAQSKYNVQSIYEL